MKLTINNLKATMRWLNESGDSEGYDDLWKSIVCLHNLGLLEDNIAKAMVAEDYRLFESNGKED